MSKYKYLLYITIFLGFTSWEQPERFKRINLYQKIVSIEVPQNWKYKEKYRKFSNYQIIYDAKISDEKSKSALTVDVYDSSHMYNTPITNELLASFKDALLKTKGQSLKVKDEGVIKVNKNDVGFLKYTFINSNGKRLYGAQLFFRTSFNNFYEIEVYSLGKSASDFESTAERIIKSLHFN
jgi:hypothetical protein